MKEYSFNYAACKCSDYFKEKLKQILDETTEPLLFTVYAPELQSSSEVKQFLQECYAQSFPVDVQVKWIGKRSMAQAVGAFNSPNYHDTVLHNWARLKKIKLGCFGNRGLSLSVRPALMEGFEDCEVDWDAAFVIDCRGHALPLLHERFVFNTANRETRKKAFVNAVKRYNELRKEITL